METERPIHMLTLLVYTIALALASLAITKSITGTYRAAGTAYWAGWTLLALCTVYVEWRNLVPVADDDAILMVEIAHTVAFVAFISGAGLASGRKRRAVLDPVSRLAETERIIRRFSFPWLLALAAFGLAFLLEQILTVGLNLSALMTDLRSSYLAAGTLPWTGRLYSYISTSVVIASVLLARSDRLYGIRVKRLVVLVVAMGFGGFAMGGRGFLVTPVFSYIAAYLMMPKIASFGAAKRALVSKEILIYLTGAVVVFSVMGEWRWGTDRVNEDDAFYVRVIDNPAVWIATSMRGITPYVATLGFSETHGRAFFYWPFVQAEKVGLLPGDTQGDLLAVRADVKSYFGDPANFPPTIIPFLYGDWGSFGWPVALFILCFLAQFLTLSLDPFTLGSHLVCTMLMLATFYTIQDALFFSPNNCVAIIWFGLFRLLLSFTDRGKSLIKRVSPRTPSLPDLGPGRNQSEMRA